jgi:hypothetical protein
MTSAERKRRSRLKSVTLPAQERDRPGIAVSPSAVSGTPYSQGDEMTLQTQILLQMAARQEELLAKFDQVLEHLLRQSPDYRLSPEEFRVIASVGALANGQLH